MSKQRRLVAPKFEPVPDALFRVRWINAKEWWDQFRELDVEDQWTRVIRKKKGAKRDDR